MQRQMPCLTPHDFDYHDAIVTRRCEGQAVERIGNGIDSCIKADRSLCECYIIVDRFSVQIR